jgi:hypothetical protein
MSNHLVLLGDSILDNASYVPSRRPAVIDHVRNRLPSDWTATLRALDGSTIRSVFLQLRSLPADASHLVLSVGGNDVLAEIGILHEPVATVGEALHRLAAVRDAFEEDYRELLLAITERALPTAVCTIYNPCSDDYEFQRAAVAALGVFNDCIIRAAREVRFSVIELRAVCTEPAHYANEIEPSALGGAKIAEAIMLAVAEWPAAGRSLLFP